MSDRSHIAAVAQTAAEAGATVAAAQFEETLDISNKGSTDGPVGPADVVTETDRAAQRRVSEVIRDHDAESTIVGEENDAPKEVPADGRVWVIDPIDGTFNFVRGLHYWTTSVAVTVDSEPIVGCSVFPALESTYVAADTGSLRDGEPVSVSSQADAQSATVAPIIPPSYGQRESYVEGLGTLFQRFGTTVRFCSAQATFALIAQGAIEGAVTPQRPNPWDSLAGAHLVRQAGGTVTDLHGNRWTVDSEHMVASNGHVHDELRSVGRELL